MAHPYANHSENAVAKRRVKTVMKSGGYVHSDAAADKKLMKKMMAKHEKEEMGKHEGMKAGGRLDRRARGGAVGQFAMGGTVDGIRKPTPSKRRPHVAVNVVNISGGGGRRGMSGPGAGIRPPLGAPPVPPPAGVGGFPGPVPPGPPAGLRPPGMKRGGGVAKRQVGGPLVLPVQANPRAAAALATRPVLPSVARAVRPFAKGGAIGKMRSGKDYGQGSGEGRLEEFKHMKGR